MRLIWLLFGLLCLAGFASGIHAEYEKQQLGLKVVQPPDFLKEGKDGLLVYGALELQPSRQGASVVRVNLENRTLAAVDQIEVQVNAPGFRLDGDCWGPRNTLICTEGGTAPPDALQPGQSLSLAAIASVSLTGVYRLAAQAIWRGSDGRQTQILNLGTYEFTQPNKSLFLAFYTVFSNLALPLVLLVGGWLYKEYNENQASLRRKAEREQDDERSRREQEREQGHRIRELIKTQEHQILNTMLTTSINYMTKYYLPILRSVSQVRRHLAYPVQHSKEALLNLLKFRQAMRQLSEEIGGVFFKSLEAERIVAQCWRIIHTKLEERFGEDLLIAIGAVEPKERIDKFKTRFKASKKDADAQRIAKTLRNLEQNLIGWPQGEMERVRLLFDLFYSLMEFEMNRPLASWYRPGTWHRATAPEKEIGRIEVAIERVKGRPELLEIANEAAQYCKRLREPLGAEAAP